jgi:hypothetical protein
LNLFKLRVLKPRALARILLLTAVGMVVSGSLPVEPADLGVLDQTESDALFEHRCPEDGGNLWWTGETLWTGQTPDDKYGETVFRYRCMRGHEWWLLAEMVEYGPSAKGPVRRA